jgi:hypothetical protein
MFRSFLVLALALAAAVLTGCASAAASTAQGGPPTPSLPCSLPYDTHVALVSPAPGSSGVAGSAPVVVVASRELPKAVTVVAVDRKGRAVAASGLEKLPAPPPHAAAPGYADPVFYRAVGLALSRHRHYTLAVDDVAQNGCAPYAPLTGDARFST